MDVDILLVVCDLCGHFLASPISQHSFANRMFETNKKWRKTKEQEHMKHKTLLYMKYITVKFLEKQTVHIYAFSTPAYLTLFQVQYNDCWP